MEELANLLRKSFIALIICVVFLCLLFIVFPPPKSEPVELSKWDKKTYLVAIPELNTLHKIEGVKLSYQDSIAVFDTITVKKSTLQMDTSFRNCPCEGIVLKIY